MAAESAKIAFLFTKVGLSGADMGAAWLLPRIVGFGLATEMLMLGEFVDARRAERIGLYNVVVPDAELEGAAGALAKRLASGTTRGLAVTKRMLNAEAAMTFDDALQAEGWIQAVCMQHPDYREAYEAFVAKRPADFVKNAPGARPERGRGKRAMTAETADLRARARALGARLGERLASMDEEEAALAALAGLAEAELVAWTVPARDGGAATDGLAPPNTVSARALCALRDELAWHSGMLDVMLVMQGLGSFPVALGGSPKLRAEVLPDVAAGRAVAAFALTEPGAGSSLVDVATRAERRGDKWVLSGHKTFISNAADRALLHGARAHGRRRARRAGPLDVLRARRRVGPRRAAVRGARAAPDRRGRARGLRDPRRIPAGRGGPRARARARDAGALPARRSPRLPTASPGARSTRRART